MQTYLLCNIQGQRFAFEVEKVHEAVRMPWVTAIAETPPDVCGVVNYRGKYVAVVDPALRLTGRCAERGLDSYLVIMTLGNERVALVVDRVDSLTHRTPAPTPANAGTPAFVRGHIDDGGGLITILDLEELLRPDVREFVQLAPETEAPA